jgi:hypothetical protein
MFMGHKDIESDRSVLIAMMASSLSAAGFAVTIVA